ncbi:MAG: peroxidase family protein [Pseudomonadota bacterium]
MVSLVVLAFALPSINATESAETPRTLPWLDPAKEETARDSRKKQREARRARISERRFVGPLRDREVRTYDGTSNSLKHPERGSTFQQLRRLAPSDYADGLSAMSGGDRPSPRAISSVVSDQGEFTIIPNSFGTSDFVWQWGQFIDHDIGLTDGAAEAADIPVPRGDVYFDPHGTGTQVIPFTRALFDPSTGTDSPREQENEITAWIDGSMVYGSSVERAAALREGPDSPFLKTSPGNLLPKNVDGLSNATGGRRDVTNLFLAGDIRANEQVGLTAMHTLFVREHNRLARKIQRRAPKASAEDVFQAARRLVIAEIQIITYEEFLPALIGPNAIPPYRGYRKNRDGGIFNEFSVAAFRLGHSMVSNSVPRLDRRGRSVGDLALRDAFFTAPEILTSEDSIDYVLRGLASQRHQQLDAEISSELSNFLFGPPGAGGLDLAALNIQRGRDHGVPSYNDMREAMGLRRARTFADITKDPDMQQRLFEAYLHVDDVDLWVGGLAEKPRVRQGSQVGPLFRRILKRQFRNLRDGDRFWYERDLTPGEQEFVEGITLAKIIRRNTNIGPELQKNVFFVPEPRKKH